MPYRARTRLILLLSLEIIIACTANDDTVKDSTYILPYPAGNSFLLLQGNGGEYSHTGKFYYAFDFKMDIGTVITAMRGGTVVNMEAEFIDGNRTPGLENYVIVQHSDGSFARYFHLTKNGILVNLGDHVKQGQQIGLSGDTGFSTQPHLHVDVTLDCALPAPSCETIAIKFTNSVDEVPEAGKSYEAISLQH